MATNPVLAGVENGSIDSAVAKLLEPQKPETIEQEKPEQESPEVETRMAEEEDYQSETEEGEASSEESEVEGQYEEDNSEEEDKEPYYTIKYDGKEYEVTLEELKKGYQLQKDYTQKTQSLAEKRQEIDAISQQLSEERQRYIDINTHMMGQQYDELKAFENVDWKALRASDPMGYIDKMAAKQEAERSFAERRSSVEAALARQQAESQERLKAHLEAEAVVLAKQIPEYSDPVKGVEFRKSIATYGAQMGYSEQELSNVVNARDLIVLNKARLWDEYQSKKGGIREKKTGEKDSIRIKSSTPKGEHTKNRREVDDFKAKARSSGKQGDAAAALLKLMQSGKKR